MKRKLSEKIIKAIYETQAENPKNALNTAALAKAVGAKKANDLKPALADLTRRGWIVKSKNGYKATGDGFFKAEVRRIFRVHGFIRDMKSEEEFFVPGRKLLGSVPGDIVLARCTAKAAERGEGLSAAAEIILILSESQNVLTGSVVSERGEFCVLPDSFTSEPLAVHSFGGLKPKEGDKVGFVLYDRAEKHSEHIVNITKIYGNSHVARVCVSAYIDEKNIPKEFPAEVKDEAKKIYEKGIKPSEYDKRLDLRNEIIFTIDGTDTKDIDDAISVQKTKSGYTLGVHIADVSHYVKSGTATDTEAFLRGTSVYIADMVIPMLPKELSNGICSLNPNEDRLAFSCIAELDKNAEITGFKFEKTVIKSRIQGVYSEVNQLLENKASADKALKEKYADVIKTLPVMKELAEKLQKNRKDRGAPFIETRESKIICDEKGICVDIQKRESGVSENIIEEFMLTANNCAARLAMETEMPFVYRVHESPSLEKIETLRETLALIGAEYVLAGRGAADLAGIIAKARGTEKEGVISMMVLRAMMKAKYSQEPLGHFGLVMKEYAHFTSPIRRYPDLAIHRILSDYILKNNKSYVKKKYGKWVHDAGVKSSHAEMRAVSAERDCEKFFMAEYMQNHVGEEFDGIISGVSQSSFFVALPNTVEGRVSGESLGVCEYNDSISVIEQLSGKKYSLGDKVRVKCTEVSVVLGNVGFEVVVGN